MPVEAGLDFYLDACRAHPAEQYLCFAKKLGSAHGMRNELEASKQKSEKHVLSS